MDSRGGSGQEYWWMRFLKKVEIVNIFRIQIKRSTFGKFHLKIDESNLNVKKNWQNYYSRKSNLNKKLEFEGKTALRKMKM